MDKPTTIHSILQNWSLPLTTPNAILPSHLVASLPPTHLPLRLLSAIHTLSTLTIGQRERAHNLLTTYFQARIREASYSGRHDSIPAMLQVEDVEKACESARRMSVASLGTAMEPSKGVVCHATEEEKEDMPGLHVAFTERKSIFDTSDDGDACENGANGNVYMRTTQDPMSTAHTVSLPLTPRTSKRRIHLPCIQTSSPLCTQLAPSSFTPLFQSLNCEFSNPAGDVTALLDMGPNPASQLYQLPYYLSGTSFCDEQQDTQVDLASLEETNLHEDTHGTQEEAEAEVKQEEEEQQNLRAAQRATHEYNLRRLDLRVKKREYASARLRCEDARRRMLSLRSSAATTTTTYDNPSM
ncbi:hypothetical protein ACJBU6_07363 [Exserohilum turcicum]